MWILELASQRHVFKDIGLYAQNMLTILGSIVNKLDKPIWPLNEHKILHFDND